MLGKRKIIGEIDYNKAPDALKYFGEQIRNEKLENSIVIDKNGTVYQFIGGESSVDIFDVELNGAYVTHNHPASQGIVSFGKDDFDFLREHQGIKEFRCCNMEYEYSIVVLKPLDDVVYNEIYKEAIRTMNPFEDEIQDKTMDILSKDGYIKYDKRRFE